MLNSTLLAQLVANLKFKRETAINLKEWYNFYCRVLETVGWVVTRPGYVSICYILIYVTTDMLTI